MRVVYFLEGMLGLKNLRVVWVENTPAGINRLPMDSFDLLITDGWMPNEGDGIELANWAKNAYPNMPIIMLTSAPPAEGTKNIDVVIEKTPQLYKLREAVIELLKLQRRMF
jgi:DNA-binding NtrC family response regulator